MKRTISIICAVVVFLSLLSYGTYALITSDGVARNIVTLGKINFEIREITDGGKPFPVSGVSVIPGDNVKKVVTGKNTGLQSIYLRVKLTKSVEDSDLPAEEQLKLDINDKDWTFKDGYYYYNKELGIAKETEPLFTTVSVDGASVDNAYIGKTFLLNIEGSYVQSKNNGKDVFSAVGWSADSESGK